MFIGWVVGLFGIVFSSRFSCWVFGGNCRCVIIMLVELGRMVCIGSLGSVMVFVFWCSVICIGLVRWLLIWVC